MIEVRQKKDNSIENLFRKFDKCSINFRISI